MASERILVCEDNLLNLRLVSDLLQAEGYQVLEATRAQQALALARESQPGLILMDVQLPGMDGLEATHRLKSDPTTAHIPVIALTAHAMQGDRERALAAGCDGYIAKPIDVASFPAQVRHYLKASNHSAG